MGNASPVFPYVVPCPLIWQFRHSSVFITPQQVLATKALDRIGNILKDQGLSLEEMLVSGRQIRTDMLQEAYGITETPKENLS
jgi:hypothetical protein